MSHELSIYLRYLHQDQNFQLDVYLEGIHISLSLISTIWTHGTKKIEAHPKQIKGKAGCKPKLSLRGEKSIIRSLHYDRKQDGNFTSKRLKLYSGVSSVHDRTVPRV